MPQSLSWLSISHRNIITSDHTKERSHLSGLDLLTFPI